MPTDEQIHEQIEALEQERLALREREGESDPTQAQDVARLEEIRVELDRLWDFAAPAQRAARGGSRPGRGDRALRRGRREVLAVTRASA